MKAATEIPIKSLGVLHSGSVAPVGPRIGVKKPRRTGFLAMEARKDRILARLTLREIR
jgi:hypothetical protein